MSNEKFNYLLRLGDSTLILSQRLSEWCGKGPALEEDMALANTALDLLGQARQWLSYAGETDGMGQDEDDLAYLRNADQFANFLLVERPNGSYADTMVRQFFFDAWYHLALQKLVLSKDERIAAIAGKAAKEVRYHLRRSSDLIVRLGDGTPTSRSMIQSAVDELWPFTGEMFEADAIDLAVAEAKIGFDPSSLRSDWLSYVHSVLDEATIKMPNAEAWMQRGGKQGRHTEALSYLLAEMQSLKRAHPGAAW
ncbi:1,2-phenylacetyl-CoA epoxidase subunit PaaC [Hydrocarboniphaga effusa]|jgi:ring-1,2-phenylacetyl-CoA epoxidase subunit PaaC|uniref:Phenylacetic acid degradation protein n=1 Tax=Hydrocarboniphaga effusa AP103 TaxID=1172194 RepID=I7ZI81_9GAMM|nr:1,2-phenylacetyl-CoA epoxidase subunit PaaC [Hydrocarboniphaga effusa]EIT71619.1 phenylacetic acid degradation protein [Hydrocarboniphaga effusa AP103]